MPAAYYIDRVRLALVFAIGCGSAAPAPKPVPIESIAPPARTCGDAAAGLEHATRELRAPEESVLAPMRARCADDRWSASAIECFAHMGSEDLGPCAERLDETQRAAMFAVFAGGPRESLAVLTARLGALQVGIAECDRFIVAVTGVLACEAMPLETRLSLGNETVNFWSLPTKGLPQSARQRMASVCGTSLAALEQHAAGAGCHP